MTPNEYQKEQRKTAYYAEGITKLLEGDEWPRFLFLDLAYPAMKLNGEAGEFIEEVAKSLRDTGGDLEPRKEKMIDELGDVLWYVSQCANVLEIDLEDLMKRNLAKVKAKKAKHDRTN